ncbi:MAG: gamma-glutamyl-gamma-aminobutyrate hydrolase family protein [Bacteroidetes bacterium]|nr:gamma-glutamyl-gamma-aminobutyrate hydrolase family protein [Bacteroidota bacterium]
MKKTNHKAKKKIPSPLGGETERGFVIGITDCNRWANYENWFVSDKVEIIKLSPKENNVADVDRCNGIVLSGGEDVHPKYYGKPQYWKKRKELKLDVNEARDKFEMKVIARAVKNKKPILGICRGLQIANVYFKGTLIPDLQGKTRTRHSKAQGYDQTHLVEIEKNSCLSAIVSSPLPNGGRWRGAWIVNSAHHQSAEKIGKGLKATAIDKEGIVEAIEWKNPKDKPFLLLVQWHPERMKEQESGLAKNLKEKFLQSLSLR